MTRLALALLIAVGFGQLAADKVPDVTWHDCVSGETGANFAGYQSAYRVFSCKEGTLRIEGKWGLDIQNGWEYHTEFGAQMGQGPEYIGDMKLDMQMPKFQKWCKTAYGYTLCGWNDEEQRRQDEQRKIRSRNVPAWRKP